MKHESKEKSTPIEWFFTSRDNRKIDKSLKNIIPDFDKRYSLELFSESFSLRPDLLTNDDFEVFYETVFKGKTKSIKKGFHQYFIQFMIGIRNHD